MKISKKSIISTAVIAGLLITTLGGVSLAGWRYNGKRQFIAQFKRMQRL